MSNLYSTGKLYANSATIKGTIEANAGSIGGWKISSSAISVVSKDGNGNETGGMRLNADGSIKAGVINSNSYYPFQVTADGILRATGASISGDIIATSLTLGGNTTIPQDKIEGLSGTVSNLQNYANTILETFV